MLRFGQCDQKKSPNIYKSHTGFGSFRSQRKVFKEFGPVWGGSWNSFLRQNDIFELFCEKKWIIPSIFGVENNIFYLVLSP